MPVIPVTPDFQHDTFPFTFSQLVCQSVTGHRWLDAQGHLHMLCLTCQAPLTWRGYQQLIQQHPHTTFILAHSGTPIDQPFLNQVLPHLVDPEPDTPPDAQLDTQEAQDPLDRAIHNRTDHPVPDAIDTAIQYIPDQLRPDATHTSSEHGTDHPTNHTTTLSREDTHHDDR